MAAGVEDSETPLGPSEPGFTRIGPDTPASPVDDDPVEIRQGRNVWTPANYDDEYQGRTTFRRALMKSANAATVRISRAVGEALVPMRAQSAPR